MRLARVTCTCAVAISSLGLFASGASAFKHPNQNGRCRISIEAPHEITKGEEVVIFGRLICRGRASAADKVVRLYHHLRGVPGFSYVQSTTTNDQGVYEFQPADGVVETSRIWHVRAHGAESANKGVRVAAQVTLIGPPEGTQILTGPTNKVTFTGNVSPADEGARVILERQNSLTGNAWHRIDFGEVQADGSFSISHRFIVPGDANIRALVRSQGRNIPSPSGVLAYEISQAQNPALTIGASVDPITFGQSVTIAGTLVGSASQPVTLLARTVRQRGFAPVAQATTNASGEYTFPAQMPVYSTFYKVQGAGKSSAVLYEGVKDVLTAEVSASTVQEGQKLTFTGTVTPSHPGHVVYLERHNATGEDFHVVQVGTVTNESTFAIAYQVYGTGTQVFRVHIPGGPENGGATSQLFTIQVTPAPPGTLVAEAPNNTSLPTSGSEGSEGSNEGRETVGESSEGAATGEGSSSEAAHGHRHGEHRER